MAKSELPRHRTRSVRARLMLPVAAAISGMLVLGIIGVQTSLKANDDAGRARLLSELANATAEVLHVGQAEVGEVARSHAQGADYYQTYQEAMDATDAATSAYQDVAERVRSEVPELSAVLTTANGAVDQVADARDALSDFATDPSLPLSDPETKSGFEVYRSIAARMLDVADAIHVHIEDRELAEQARALAALAGAKQAAAEQRYLVQNELGVKLVGGSAFPTPRLTELAHHAGVEQQRLGEFYRATTPRGKSLYVEAASQSAAIRSERMIETLLSGRQLSASEAKDWDSTQSERTDALRGVESSITKDLEALAIAKETESQQTAVLTAVAVLAITAISFGGATLFAFRVSKRLKSLRRDALAAAEETLPEAVAQMTKARSEKQIDDAVVQAEGVIQSGHTGSLDEIGAVSQAFRVVHAQALRMAADQATLRLDVAAMMISLARRGQGLVQRQLHMLDDFAKIRRDRDTNDRVEVLNHLAARMRRNEENLLLLAGGDPGRRHTAAASIAHIVAEASTEIEDSKRVLVEGNADTRIVSKAVGDVVHLLAELLENAAQFSPPHTHVRVTTRQTVQEVVISVSDEGIGLQPADAEEINARLASPSALTASLAGTLGLLVVGRLAMRHDIDVQLHSTAGKGTLAIVRIPNDLVSIDEPYPTHRAPARPQQPLAIATSPASIPVTGSGEGTSIDRIVPKQRAVGNVNNQTKRAGKPSTTPNSWFMPRTGSGEESGITTSGLNWRETAADAAYDKTRRAIADIPQPSATTHVDADGLPRRSPGARLIPGSVSVPTSTSQTSRDRVDGLDPEEIRNRLSGFAGGIAAARHSPSVIDKRPSSGDQ